MKMFWFYFRRRNSFTIKSEKLATGGFWGKFSLHALHSFLFFYRFSMLSLSLTYSRHIRFHSYIFYLRTNALKKFNISSIVNTKRSIICLLWMLRTNLKYIDPFEFSSLNSLLKIEIYMLELCKWELILVNTST